MGKTKNATTSSVHCPKCNKLCKTKKSLADHVYIYHSNEERRAKVSAFIKNTVSRAYCPKCKFAETKSLYGKCNSCSKKLNKIIHLVCDCPGCSKSLTLSGLHNHLVNICKHVNLDIKNLKTNSSAAADIVNEEVEVEPSIMEQEDDDKDSNSFIVKAKITNFFTKTVEQALLLYKVSKKCTKCFKELKQELEQQMRDDFNNHLEISSITLAKNEKEKYLLTERVLNKGIVSLEHQCLLIIAVKSELI